MSRILLVIVAFALVAAACSGDDAAPTTTTTTVAATSTQPTTTTTSTSTTTLPPTTTTTFDPLTTVTTIPEGFASPINGLAAERDGLLDRRAFGVKIDNHPRARPQSGVNDADMVIEIRVEGGLTRFIAIFHDNESDYVGPVRSVRPTDSSVLAPMGAPLVMSGGQPWVQRVHTGRGVGLIGEGAANLFRINAKVAPHNLFGTTEDMRLGADTNEFDDDPPGPLYSIVQWSIPDLTADQIVVDWSDNVTATWDWDAENGTYTRTHNGAVHEILDIDGAAEPIAVEVLVILAGEFFTQFPPPEDSDWQEVPATETLGSGQAWVFARGAVWEGTWQRDAYDEPFTLLNPDGTEAGVPPGFSWVSIFPEQRTVTWE